MLRSALRAIPAARASVRVRPGRRLLSTAPPARKPSSWKGAAVRWGLAAYIVYWYQTTDVFAEEADRERARAALGARR